MQFLIKLNYSKNLQGINRATDAMIEAPGGWRSDRPSATSKVASTSTGTGTNGSKRQHLTLNTLIYFSLVFLTLPIFTGKLLASLPLQSEKYPFKTPASRVSQRNPSGVVQCCSYVRFCKFFIVSFVFLGFFLCLYMQYVSCILFVICILVFLSQTGPLSLRWCGPHLTNLP